MAHFICEISKSAKLKNNEVKKRLTEGVFTNNFIKEKFNDFQLHITDHEKEEKIPKERLIKFVSYLKLVRQFTKKFKQELIELSNKLYISTYQAAGVSIRKLGRIDVGYETSSLTQENAFHLQKSINKLIKLLRKTKGRVYVVIDAIRNPYEARYFRGRYSAFYLMSINAPDKDRNKYLKDIHKFDVEQLKQIEEIESGNGSSLDNKFVEQNVKRCIEISDIHILNPRNELTNHNVLKAQLAWYFSLMIHPGLFSPTPMERIMQIAYTAKTNSGCISRQVGAVITDNNYSIKAIGWNDVPEGQYPCSLRSINGLLNEYDREIYSEYELNNQAFLDATKTKYKIILNDIEELNGRNLAYCFKDLKNSVDENGNQVHTRSLHAEENAFLQIVKYGGQSIKGGKLYTTASPCELCAKKAYQLGIAEIVYIDPYSGIARDHILSIGANPPSLIQFRGAIGKGYLQLYEPILPYKDEIEYFL